MNVIVCGYFVPTNYGDALQAKILSDYLQNKGHDVFFASYAANYNFSGTALPMCGVEDLGIIGSNLATPFLNYSDSSVGIALLDPYL